ncbi:hypothetical protein CW745_07165 [Psychromonas sp. psych-6C06]|uniref:DUF2913 family protein n=1 Tax=Psychromonas sp. psych-6C06 TaxID=2058089 RepID=UPI000C337227|nr:DUF2913 family protein [Psychromonas sp. psych-6C06]PKF62169.1 hypothetical protein CW745_07165 [Psychromonas sp. psych-6C06]
MVLFSQEIYTLISTALSELEASQASGRTPKNPLNEAHYLGAWVTTAMKQKRFDGITVPTLKAWQSKARSLGKNAGLKDQFAYLQKCYDQVLDEDKKVKVVSRAQVDALVEALELQQWMVNTDLIVGNKLNRHSGGAASLIICADELADCFDEQDILIKPLSIYLRGDLQILVGAAFTQNLLLHKITDYKSKVKYHGEFIVYPNNDGEKLPEFPIDVVLEK